MKDYKIISINYEEYDAIIYSEARRHPLSNIEEIEQDLEKLNLKMSKVLFDMILCRGNTTDRFMECKFDGNSLIKGSMSVKSVGKKDDIRKLSTKYLVENREMVEKSNLTSVQKKMILKGITI